MGLAALPDAGVTVDAGDEDGAAASAYASPDVGWELGACALGDAAEEPDVSAALGGVGAVRLFGLVEEYLYALLRDASGVCAGHFICGLGGWKVYKTIGLLIWSERGGAARLARGAHNPKVGSSNLPPATTCFCVCT